MTTSHNDLKNIFNDVRGMVSRGLSYREIHKKYQIVTKTLYEKLGGAIRKQRFDNENTSSILIQGDSNYAPTGMGEVSEDLICGTVLGDATVEMITDNKYTETALIRFSHCWQQVAYCKVLYELFKPFSSAITIKPTTEINKDYVIQITTITTPSFVKYRKLFYTQEFDKKFVFKDDIVEKMTMFSLAIWLMDDGRKRSSAPGCFSITIGVQPYYTFDMVEKFTQALSEKLGVRLYCLPEKNSYSIHTLKDSVGWVTSKLAPYIIPDFSYKIGLEREACGSYFEKYAWYKEWEISKRTIEHPHIERFPYREFWPGFRVGQKEKYLRVLLSRTRVRGFPFDTPDNADLTALWNVLKNSEVRDLDGKLTASPKANLFASHFFRHRYLCNQKGRKSPMDIFVSNKELRKVLELQLNSGPEIYNSNIRNAICTYGSTGLGQFNSAIARYLTEKFCTGKNVLDPCSGWGNRLSGVVAAGKNYYGIDPSERTYHGLLNIKEWLSANNFNENISIVKGFSENPDVYGGNIFDFAITSPPYFDVEIYDNENQSNITFNTYEKWLSGFLGPMICNVYAHLKNGAVFALNVGDSRGYDLNDRSKSYMEIAGFNIESTYLLKKILRPGMEKAYQEIVIIGRKLV